jgi:hypothetical protein
MNENIPNKSEKEIREQRIGEYIALAREFVERGKIFPFPGISKELYESMKKTDEEMAEEYSGYFTPVDTMIENFKKEGVKVVLGDDPESGNIYIMPANGGTIEMDGMLIEYLNINGDMDEDIKKLILASPKK